MTEYDSNKQLAKDYLNVMIKYGGSWVSYGTMRNKIACFPIDLVAFFEKNHSFDNLPLKGFGAKTRAILELILWTGVDESQRYTERAVKQAQEAKRTSGSRPLAGKHRFNPWSGKMEW